VRVVVHALSWLGDAHQAEQLDSAGMRRLLRHLLMSQDRLSDLRAHPELRVQARQRILEHHCDLGTAHLPELIGCHGNEIGAVEERRTTHTCTTGQAEHGLHGDGLATARLPHDPERATLLHRERRVLYSLDHAIRRLE
jgi:hypothetical protein